MSKVIFMSLPYHGHTYPATPLVTELVRRGEHVIFYSHEEFRPMIEAAGAEFRNYGFEKMIPDPKKIITLKTLKLLLQATLHVTENFTEEIKKENPDYILHDSTAHWGRIISKTIGVPAISVFVLFSLNNRLAREAQLEELKPMNNLLKTITWGLFNVLPMLSLFLKVRHKFGYKPESLANLVNVPNDLNIVLVSRMLQPYNNLFDESYRFIGPSLGKRLEKLDKELEDFINQETKLVYIALGSVYHENLEFYRNCIEAFQNSDFRVLISCGNRISPEEFEELPPHIMIRQSVPQLEVLKKASLFFTHGGINSINEGFYYGIPMVVIPQAIDQFIIANQVERLKAGIAIRKKAPSPEQLLQAQKKIFSNPEYLENTLKVRDSLQESGGPPEAADEIFQFKKEKAIR